VKQYIYNCIGGAVDLARILYNFAAVAGLAGLEMNAQFAFLPVFTFKHPVDLHLPLLI